MNENVLMATFNNEEDAKKAFKVIKLANKEVDLGYRVLQGALVRNNHDKFDVLDQYTEKFVDISHTMIGGGVGIVLGVLIGPLAGFVLAGLGAMIGSGFDISALQESENMLYQMYSRVLDGEIAVLSIVQEDDELELNSSIGQYASAIYRWDAAEIHEEAEYAMEVRSNLLKDARAMLKREKSEERKNKVDEYKKDIKHEFTKLEK